MSLKEWFEERRKISGSIEDLIERTSKDYIVNEMDKNKNIKIDFNNRLWVQCDNRENLLYIKYLRQNKSVCEECGYHLQMNSSDRIELSIDHGTWHPMDEDMAAPDPIQFHFEDEPYIDRITSCQIRTGLTDAVQTGIGRPNGIPIAIGVMDFQFMGGSMGSVVGEKITRLIEYATKESLPVIMVCASGGARMQEGSFSLMQMAKISTALYIHQLEKKLLYVSILTYPTTGGVTASFGMLGDIIIVEPKAYIAFAGRRVIEQTSGQKVPDGLQVAEHLFDHGSFDLIVPRSLLKGVLSELFQLYGSIPCEKERTLGSVSCNDQQLSSSAPRNESNSDTVSSRVENRNNQSQIIVPHLSLANY
uniref:Acetyl-coenzyme A carboxylase carboxyl transferase subunit beta, chloroplastic n=1 Tax=Encephalartos lehmannii TaxID=179210 RepID=A0A0A6Z7T0_9SPER|nr:acetyl-CoA carboxylase beta subunit [Encephalartos lehmannii]AFR53216.1 acetyl-CoA carboxylase beta subunit [Encephalartos lehmannii]BAR93818.1 acetyl-CoA carboxylase beta subunit [Encephalartos lehmannii]